MCTLNAVKGQSIRSDSVKTTIVNGIVKRCMMQSMISAKNNLYDAQLDNKLLSTSFNFSLPGFSYFDYFDLFNIEPYFNSDYHAKGEKMFKVSLTKNEKYDSIVSLDDGVMLLGIHKYALVSLDTHNDFKCLSGCYIDDDILKDFRIRRNKPKSYIPYLKVKLASRDLDSISFDEKNGKTFKYIGRKLLGDKMHFYSLAIDKDKPQKVNLQYLRSEEFSLGPNGSQNKLDNANKVRSRILLKNQPFEVKRKFILNQLTKNIYLYKLVQEMDINSKLFLDTSAWVVKSNSVYWDSLLPNYSETIYNMDIITVYDKQVNYYSFVPKFVSCLYKPDGRSLVATSISDGVEFYRIWKDTATVLCSNIMEECSTCYCRYDYYYLPTIKQGDQQFHLSCNGCPPKPPEIYDIPKRYNGTPIGFPYDVWKGNPLDNRIDYYLIALDVKKNRIYFISGKDIFINNATHLYEGLKNVDDNIDFPSLEHKLVYIQDRLYKYQVKEITKENIVKQDEKSMTLMLEGKERGTAIKLEVVFHDDTPELLKIKIR